MTTTTNVLVPPWIPGSPKILVVGQGPAVVEAARLRPFVGRDGQQLQAWLREIGIDPDEDVAYTNVVQYFNGDSLYKPTEKEVKDARVRLTFELLDKVFPVPAVVLMGAVACHMVWSGKMGEMHGQHGIWPGLDFPVDVFGAWHPGAYRNARSAQGKREKERDVKDVLARAWRTANGLPIDTVDLPEYRLESSYVVQ